MVKLPTMRIPIPVVLALILTLLASSTASACGTVQHWISRYNDTAASDESRSSALLELSRNCDGYEAVDTDRALLPVLTDALGRGVPQSAIQAVFDNFRCLPGAESEAGYALLEEAMDKSACPDADELALWSVVTVTSANIRSRPDVASARAGVAMRGSVVIVEQADGQWLAVATWAGDRGYIHRDLVTPFPDYRAGRQ